MDAARIAHCHRFSSLPAFVLAVQAASIVPIPLNYFATAATLAADYFMTDFSEVTRATAAARANSCTHFIDYYCCELQRANRNQEATIAVKLTSGILALTSVYSTT